MFRTAKGPAPSAFSRSGNEEAVATDASEICPVCKSSRYMNPSMRFLVNPECYHRMCSSCVDRIFAAGRAKCPIAKCPKMLRKGGFRKQLFEDVKMEREKDVREQVAEVFNRREEDFESLREYNDYLELAEDISFGLINGIDEEENRRKLQQYKEQYKADIEANKRVERQEEMAWAERQAEEKRLLQLKRKQVKDEEEEERLEKEFEQKKMLDDMTKSKGNANDIARRALERYQDKARKKATGKPSIPAAEEKPSFVIRGLKQASKPEQEKPYDPFGGLSFRPKYSVSSPVSGLDSIDKLQNQPGYAAGGYDMEGYYQRSLTMSTFAGLGIFVGE